MEHYPSYFESEPQLLQAVIDLHIPKGQFDCDPMFFKGNFYRADQNTKIQIKRPEYIFDLNPQLEDCLKADAKALPLESTSIYSMILDPPFQFEKRNRRNAKYASLTHGIYRGGFDELENEYKLLLVEAYRVLCTHGILVFKCQDYTDGKTTMTHCYVWDWAQRMGFYPKDLAILKSPKSKVYNGNLKQRHLRKVHTYFWVFEKK